MEIKLEFNFPDVAARLHNEQDLKTEFNRLKLSIEKLDGMTEASTIYQVSFVFIVASLALASYPYEIGNRALLTLLVFGGGVLMLVLSLVKRRNVIRDYKRKLAELTRRN